MLQRQNTELASQLAASKAAQTETREHFTALLTNAEEEKDRALESSAIHLTQAIKEKDEALTLLDGERRKLPALQSLLSEAEQKISERERHFQSSIAEAEEENRALRAGLDVAEQGLIKARELRDQTYQQLDHLLPNSFSAGIFGASSGASGASGMEEASREHEEDPSIKYNPSDYSHIPDDLGNNDLNTGSNPKRPRLEDASSSNAPQERPSRTAKAMASAAIRDSGTIQKTWGRGRR